MGLETDTIHHGDAFDVLPTLPEESVHACVTDPPYGLAFMGRDWDDFEPKEYQAWCERWAREVKRVLKPGGHLLAFSGNRTHHRLFTGVEDAGYEIRDTITWHYGSGFPKASDISKTIDKRADAEREKQPNPLADKQTGQYDSDTLSGDREPNDTIAPEPATDAAKEWDGFKTGLKPATEYVVVARKPFDGATVDCVLEHGTGALNIDGTRITIDEPEELQGEWDAESNGGTREKYGDFADDDGGNYGEGKHSEGRYPSNVVFDEVEAERLDREVGETSSGGGASRNGDDTASTRYDDNGGTDFAAEPGQRRGDSGGPSRYFYTSKASKAERTHNGSITNTHTRQSNRSTSWSGSLP